MPTDGNGDSPVEQALAGGQSQRIGWYRFHFDDERWEWSPEVEAIHGYQPGTAVPTTELVLSHKHPDDYEHVAATLEDIRRSHKPFSTRHRIITVQGATRDVVVIAESFTNEDGQVAGTEGLYIDVTASPASQQEAITAAIADLAEHRAVIEQVKGVLMFVYQIDATAAFDLLRWRSQDRNVKLRDLAEQLQADLRGMRYDQGLPHRSEIDHLLLTAYQRLKGSAKD
jgi:hypothetical protein